MSIEHVLAVVSVSDLEKSRRWYTDFFGRPADNNPMPTLVEWQVLPGAWVQVFSDPDRAGSSLVNFAVDDLEKHITEVRGRGIEPGEIVAADKGVRLSAIDDPDGNTIRFIGGFRVRYCVRFTVVDFRAALLDQTRAFGELIRSADPSTPVPTCPQWTLKHLFRHVGRGNRWAAQIVADRRIDPLDPHDVRDGKPPDDPDAAIDWLNDGAQLIVNAVDRAGADARVWTFVGMRPAGWWIRRRLHEVTVHQADAALAIGASYDPPVDLAADAISEWIELMTVRARRQGPPVERGRILHLHATDDGLGPTGEWTIVNDEEGVGWSHEHGKGDVALRGPAKELLLAIARRRSASEAGVELIGDAAVWDGWLERTPF